MHFGDLQSAGPIPRLWHRMGYFSPDVYYESLVAQLVGPDSAWLDLGCGRAIFPSNPQLAKVLAERCKLLVGVDPDQTIEENPFIHRWVRCPIEEYESDTPFDIVTLRMVAEHIADPKALTTALARLTKPGAMVVVYTVNRWSPVSVASALVPFELHHAAKRFLWRTEDKDTFPVAYRMNTKKCLGQLFETQGFRQVSFAYLPDCRSSFRFRSLHLCELSVWKMMTRFGLTYPENCLLAVYQRV